MLSSPELIREFPVPVRLEQSTQRRLTARSTLQELSSYDVALSTSQLTKEVSEAFDLNSLLPGILLIDQGNFIGMLSRQRFLQQMSKPYSLEPFLERPLALLYRLLNRSPLVLKQDLEIIDAVSAALERSADDRYEPVVIHHGDRYSLVDFHHLLIAQSRIHQLTAELLDQRTQDYLVQTEKMASLGRMVAGVSHEIKNPVNCIHGNVDFVSQYSSGLLELLTLYQRAVASSSTVDTVQIDEAEAELDLDFLRQDLPKLLRSLSFASERLFDIVSSLRNFSRFDREERQPVDIHKILDGTLLVLNGRIGQDIDVVKQYEKLPQVTCYPGQIGQVFMNIVSNAVEALSERANSSGGVGSPWRPQLSLTTKALSGPGRVLIRIGDNGSGIPPEIQRQIFKEFSTTKSIDEGTGLGLAISHQIVENHQGAISLRSQVEVGTEFDITLPMP